MPPSTELKPKMTLDDATKAEWRATWHKSKLAALRATEWSELDLRLDGYKLASRKAGHRIYKRKANVFGLCDLLSIGMMEDGTTTLGEIAAGLFADNAADHRTLLAMRWGDNYLHGDVLSTIESARPTTSKDMVLWSGVKHVKCKLDASEVFEPRDTTYFECICTTTNGRGQDVLFVLRDSHEFNQVPTMPEVVRMQMQEWLVFTQTSPTTIEFMHSYKSNPMGNYPTFLFNKQVVAMHAEYALRLSHYSRQRWLLDHITRHVPMLRETPYCACSAPLKFGGARHVCRCCCRAMCTKCVLVVPQALPPNASEPATTVDFCKQCLLQAHGRAQLSLMTEPRKQRKSSSSSSLDTTTARHESSRSNATEPCESDDEVDARRPPMIVLMSPAVSERWSRGTSSIGSEPERKSGGGIEGASPLTTVHQFDSVQASLEAQHKLLSDMQDRLQRYSSRRQS
ncbi:Aste57867_23038 [Aphanomyces stellatus]|uniref:Aste57867_23038 protein n=1 Tax=Aphanomyces stellatus TaxID=120398 RepID=A0A485LM52_9STRA|nr:hypothetical protein As57867_022967 [Aphanomyces stellatus]VFT99686.1 Aste57867_23038 [Aphanomyces stellatus]